MPPAGCGSAFPAKGCPDVWRSGSHEAMRGQWIWQMRQNCDSNSPASEVSADGRQKLSGKELGSFCWPVLSVGTVFLVHSSVCWAYFSGCNVSGRGFRKLSWLAGRQWPWPSFGTSLALASALELPLGSPTELVIASSCIKSTFHLTSQSDQEMFAVVTF